MENLIQDTTVQKPKWIRVKLPTGKNYRELRTLVDKYNHLPERKLSEYGGMLGRRNGNVHDFRKYLYQKLWILRGKDRKTDGCKLG